MDSHCIPACSVGLKRTPTWVTASREGVFSGLRAKERRIETPEQRLRRMGLGEPAPFAACASNGVTFVFIPRRLYSFDYFKLGIQKWLFKNL